MYLDSTDEIAQHQQGKGQHPVPDRDGRLFQLGREGSRHGFLGRLRLYEFRLFHIFLPFFHCFALFFHGVGMVSPFHMASYFEGLIRYFS